MDKNTLLTRIAAVLIALLETNGTPESMLYMFCNMNMGEYETLKDILVKAGFVNIKGNFVTLTTDGKLKATQINAVLAK